MKKISCRFLQRAVYYAPDELRHCCQRYYVNGKLMGDYGVKDHEHVGALFLKNLGYPNEVCRLVGCHIITKRYLITN